MAVQPRKIAYVTGSSKGIGKALTEVLLEDGYHVIGMSRSNTIEHPHFNFVEVDLASIAAVKKISFEKGAEEVLLVNNAGLISDIGPVGTIDNQSIEQTTIVNTLAPQILCNNFIKRFKNDKGQFHILNISSGAAQKSIEGWATYCASKAALDLFSETISEELEWMEQSNWSIHSCAPGVVDTNMQVQIRSSKPENFKRLQIFKDLKANGELASSEQVAQKLKMLIDHPKEFQNVVLSVRDF